MMKGAPWFAKYMYLKNVANLIHTFNTAMIFLYWFGVSGEIVICQTSQNNSVQYVVFLL